MARTRLGVALLIPEPVRTEVDGLRRAVADGALGRVPAHLTLVPPVNVNERDLDAALGVMRSGAADAKPIRLRLGPPATFLPENRVLYLEVGGDLDELSALRDAIFRVPLERTLAWPWVPHVTLCDEGDSDRLERAVVALADYGAEVVIDRVHLLREADRVWTPFADAALGGRRVVARGGLELELTESGEPDSQNRRWLDDEWVRHNSSTGHEWDQRPFTLTARREGEVVGVATGWTNRGVAYLSELVVGAAVRGQGIGAHLLAAFEDLAVRRECSRLSLRTPAGEPPEAFYRARGWRTEVTLTEWIDGRQTLQMRKDV